MNRSISRAVLLASASLLSGAPALAQDAGALSAQAPAVTDETTIIVTGTRRTDRTVADSPVPIDVIGADAIKNTGATDTNKILNQLVPSFNFPQPSISDGSDALRPATLRGLGPDQTLVLINGKRRHTSALVNINGTVGRGSAAVDMNLIPGLAISRIEVLRDGASSQYGSDAIAGVINIQLKNASHGGRVSVSYGKYITTIDGVDNVTGLQLNSAGQPQLDPNDNRYFLVNTNGQRKARDGDQVTYGMNLGVPIGPSGFLNTTIEYRHHEITNRAAFDIRPNYNRVSTTAPFDAREATFNRLDFRFGDPEASDVNVFVNGGFDLSPGWELYGFGSYGQRDSESAANFRGANDNRDRDYSAVAPGAALTAANFVPLAPDGFLPLIETVLGDYAGTAGVRGELAGWKTDLSIGYGHNSFDYTINHSLNTSFGQSSLSRFFAGGLDYGQTVANLDLTHEYSVGFAKPLSVAFGGEFRNENFKITPGEFQSYAIGPLFQPAITTTAANCTALQGSFSAGTCSFPGRTAAAGAQGFPGIPPASATDASRHSFSAYGEVDADPVDSLTMTVAGRYENYSDFGSTVTGKFAARFEPVKGYALRGSISNGFRAPSLHQQYFTTTSTNFVNGVPVDIATLAVGSPAARALGAQDLRPEKSVNYSFGATANPLRGLTLTADYYHIKIKDRIVLTEILGTGGTGNSTTVQGAVTAKLAALGFPQVAAARFFINGLDTTTQGVDLVGSYRWRAGSLGNWTLTAAYNYNKATIDRRLDPQGALAAIPGLILFGRVEGIRFTDGQPSDKIVLSADGDIGKFGITARSTRYGKVISPQTNATVDVATLTGYGPDDIFLSAKWITDAEVRYKLGKIELAVGANNLFDVYPDRSPWGLRPASVGGIYPANQEYIPYSIFSPFGFNGRYLYGRVGISF